MSASPPVRVAAFPTGGAPAGRPVVGGAASHCDSLALGCPRFFFPGASRVYAVVSSRARGLALGVNLNPDRYCNFDCCYCEIDRRSQPHVVTPAPVNAHAVAAELSSALAMVQAGSHLQHPQFATLPTEMLRLAHVAISGDGEPTLCPNFAEVIEGIVHLRAAGLAPYFRLVLITNGSVLDQPSVRAGLKMFTRADQLWIKLDAGTQEAMERINRSPVPLKKLLANIRDIGRQRPVVIQSMFVELDGELPEQAELSEYAHRLNELREGGAQISLVQVYSATRPPHSKRCRHLSLRVLSEIASLVHELTGLRVEVF